MAVFIQWIHIHFNQRTFHFIYVHYISISIYIYIYIYTYKMYLPWSETLTFSTFSDQNQQYFDVHAKG